MITHDATLDGDDSDSEFATRNDTLPTFNKSVDAMYNKFEFRRKQKLRHPKIIRNAMGEYVPPQGKKPLTSLAYPFPGPADYSVNAELTLDAPPMYSIIGRRRSTLETFKVGPPDHDTSQDLVWKCRHFNFKHKLPDMQPMPEGAGPSKYNVKNYNIGRDIPKCSLGQRPKGATGYPHNQDLGKDVPGSQLGQDQNKHRGPQYTFGKKQSGKCEITPGPTEYGCEPKRVGPFLTMAKKLKDTEKKKTPAPNKYNIKSYIGQAPGMPINGVRRPQMKPTTNVPAPNAYTKPCTIKKHQKASMPYRPFPMTRPKVPGPNQYGEVPKLPKGIEYSMKDKHPLYYPDNIANPQFEGVPGPAAYFVDEKDVQRNINPKYTMSKVLPLKGPTDKNPGPNMYDIPPSDPLVKPVLPSYTMAARCEIDSGSVMPSSAEYYPQIDDTGLKYSCGIRVKPPKRSKVPAPNAHRIETGQTETGIYTGKEFTFKGRQSPYVYSGLQMQ